MQSPIFSIPFSFQHGKRAFAGCCPYQHPQIPSAGSGEVPRFSPAELPGCSCLTLSVMTTGIFAPTPCPGDGRQPSLGSHAWCCTPLLLAWTGSGRASRRSDCKVSGFAERAANLPFAWGIGCHPSPVGDGRAACLQCSVWLGGSQLTVQPCRNSQEQ